MKYRITLLSIAVALLCSACTGGQRLPSGTPEKEGVSSKAVLAFVEAMEKEVDAPHGMVLLRHGKVVAQGWWSPYGPDDSHMLYSLSKSFTSTAIGMAVDEGFLSVDDTVLSFFPEDAPPNPGENLKAMRVRDLLTMTTGHAKDTLPALTGGKEENWPRVFLASPVEHKPGTHFLYNTGATYMCSAILQKVSGQTVLEYLTPRLFKPLGIENPTWESDPRGINVGGWGLKVTTLDIARFGQLYLQRGVWNGQRLICESWVEAATSFQVPNGANPQSDWNQGYGYQFWRARNNCYRGDGAFGQFCIVMPEQDAVLAITAGNRDMQQTLNLVWQHLLPAMHAAPLPPDAESHAALRAKLDSLAHSVPAGESTSATAAAVSGKRYVLEPNDAGLKTISFSFNGKEAGVVVESDKGEQRFALANGAWRRQAVPFQRLGISAAATSGTQPVAAAGAWPAHDRYVAIAWLYETPYRLNMEFTFNADHTKLTLKSKLHPLQAQPTQIKGTAE